MEVTKLPEAAQAIVDHYFNLQLGDKNVAAPYHINIGHIKDLRVMVGKGTPEEIEMEAKIWAQLKGLDLTKLSVEEIRAFMQERKIGIECSGMIYHTYNTWLLSKSHKSLIHYIKFPYRSLFGWIKLRLRPAENIGAELITSDVNSTAIKIAEMMPGDLIRSKGTRLNAHHVLLISEVGRENGVVKYFKYVHSTRYFGKDNGMREGTVEVIDPEIELREQTWLEQDSEGKKHTLEGLLVSYSDNGLRRPNFFSQLY